MFIRNEHTVRISPFAFKKKGENSRKMVSGSRIAADTGQLRFVKRVSRRAAFYCRYVTNPVARRLNFGQLVKLAKWFYSCKFRPRDEKAAREIPSRNRVATADKYRSTVLIRLSRYVVRRQFSMDQVKKRKRKYFAPIDEQRRGIDRFSWWSAIWMEKTANRTRSFFLRTSRVPSRSISIITALFLFLFFFFG